MGRAGVEHPTFTLKRHPVLDVLNTLLIRKVYICFYFTLWKTKHLIKTLFIETITLITPLFGRVHFKTNYNYRLSNHCLINELILVTYALISNAVEKVGICDVIPSTAVLCTVYDNDRDRQSEDYIVALSGVSQTLTLCMLGNLYTSLRVCWLFSKLTFFKKLFQEHYQSAKLFGSRSVCSDLGPNCLQRL